MQCGMLAFGVLIESKWNVNPFAALQQVIIAYFVLIESKWNVNPTTWSLTTTAIIGFNRIKVKCKC